MTPYTPPIAIGKVVKSNTHIDYVCQVYNLGEVEQCPLPSDYGFGTFVAIELDDGVPQGNRLVGVIYNTLLMNPDFGSLGPRLSPRQDLEIFTPDYLAETAILVGLIAVGWIDAQGVCRQGVPPQAATVNNRVIALDDNGLPAFHRDAADKLALHYAPLLLNQPNPLVLPLLIHIVDRLTLLCPADRGQLGLMRNNLAWRSIVQPAS